MKISLLGITGKMGRHLAEIIEADPNFSLVGGIVSSQSSAIGQSFCGITVEADLDHAFQEADILIDFSRPDALKGYLEKACQYTKPLVIATTGLTAQHQKLIENAALTVPILYAANMSIGITLLAQAVKEVAERLGIEYDIEIVETHHREKIDAPSGTALTLGKAAAAGRGVEFDAVKRIGCEGRRKAGQIGFAVLRGGGVFGEHTVRFLGEDEIIDLSHISLNRRLFAKGAIRAAQWLVTQGPGLYSMQDVLNKGA